MNRYWLTPPDVYKRLDDEFEFDFDPCPHPRPDGFDGLEVDWGKCNYVNPPFRKKDGGGFGPTAFVRKAIEEQEKGKTSVILIPVQSYVNLLLEAGAEMRSAGRVRWLEVDSGEPCKSPSPIGCFILRPEKETNTRRLKLSGKVVDPAFLDRFAKQMIGQPCDCGCGKPGNERAHILRGGMRTDEPWNLAWLNSACHTEFDSAGIVKRIWMFDRLIQLGRCSVRHILEAQFRFGFEYDEVA